MSNLNFDLFTRHLTDNPRCTCGFERETAEHYLLYCPLFDIPRGRTIFKLHNELVHVGILLKGRHDLNYDTNVSIFETVHHFISGSKRFD